jgi:inorganic pyrophosphatase
VGSARDEETIDVFVEVPMGSRNKYEWDFERRAFELDRMLYTRCATPATTGSSPRRSRSTATTSTPW